ncbi:MAG TPA: hypothetical protein VHT75_04410 [Acidimicrobiales bacterium]|jgi:hypothetical protein|nr:hypothetical protein [Acidimicrobiales bacterium]
MGWLAIHFRWLWADHGRFYGPTSGWIPDLTMFAAVGGGVHWYREHTCHVDHPKFCWRPGKHPVEGTPYKTCKKHYPTVPAQVTAEHIADAHAEANQ